jgi:hypothetical protein
MFGSKKQDDAALDMLAKVLKALEDQWQFRAVAKFGIENNLFPPSSNFLYTAESIKKIDDQMTLLTFEARKMLIDAGKKPF